MIGKRVGSPVPSRRPRRRGEGEAREDGRLRRRRRPLEEPPGQARNACCSGSTPTTGRSTTSALPRLRPRRHDEIASLVVPLISDTAAYRAGEPNRWGGGELEQTPVRPELVVEVRYDKVQGRRFRHGTKLVRFRPDKDPAACTWQELTPAADPARRWPRCSLGPEALLRRTTARGAAPTTRRSSPSREGRAVSPRASRPAHPRL